MKNLPFIILCSLTVLQLSAQKNIVVNCDDTYAEIQPTMWGIFFEDINFAADGGIYAELIKNRSFEFHRPLMGWKIIKKEGGEGRYYIINKDASENNPRYIKLVSDNDSGYYGLKNEGFRGMGLKQGNEYRFSVLAKGDPNLKLVVQLTNGEDAILGATIIEGFTDEWKKHTAFVVSDSTVLEGQINILIEGKGQFEMDMVSLFPKDTYKGRENGMRADLVQMLADLKPGFVRFPGGCVVEGFDLSLRYQWKKTVGPVDDREMIINRWNTEFMHRHTPDYFQSFGLGFYEYFLLSEDLGAEPLPILNCGMACQYNTGELAALDQLGPYIQDALDLIEFANGSVSTKWGKLRAGMGHPEPFNLKYIGIGNEQWGDQYVERYNIFAEAIRKKYPEIMLVSGSGPSPDDDRFRYLWSMLPDMDVDLVDEHYYKPPEWFLENATRYDNYNREGPKIFAGEYAAHGPDGEYASSRNTWLSALSEAAYITGLERNADVVYMTSYAPLFAHVEAWQWRPDLIWFDNLNVVGTPNYYVQKIYSNYCGTHAVPVTMNNENITGQDSIYASATIDKENNILYLKLVNVANKEVKTSLSFKTNKKTSSKARAYIMASNDLMTYNSIENPKNIVPVENSISVTKNKVDYTLPAQSFTVLEIRFK